MPTKSEASVWRRRAAQTAGTAAAGPDTPAARTLGPRTARVLRDVAVPCLHYAHDQALWRYRLATWTNENTYGSDRYHCLASVLGEVLADRLPGVRVHRPEDAFGTPFAVQTPDALIYPYRYGRAVDDSHAGFRVAEDSWIYPRLRPGAADGQNALALPGLPAPPPGDVVVLAWAGSRTAGLARAFLGVPRLDPAGRIHWQGDVDELALDRERDPALAATDPPRRHSLVDQPDAFAEPQPTLVLAPRPAAVDLDALLAQDRP